MGPFAPGPARAFQAAEASCHFISALFLDNFHHYPDAVLADAYVLFRANQLLAVLGHVGGGSVAEHAMKIHRLPLPIIGWVCMREEVRFTGPLKRATVSCEAGRWFVALLTKGRHNIHRH
jgi:hypothetical protein